MAMDLKNENDRKIKVEGYSKSIKKMETGDPTW
jgi:hypothetical protein